MSYIVVRDVFIFEKIRVVLLAAFQKEGKSPAQIFDFYLYDGSLESYQLGILCAYYFGLWAIKMTKLFMLLKYKVFALSLKS